MKDIINLSVLVLLVSSCVQSTPGGRQGAQSVQEVPESETPQISILFDETAGVASTASNFYFVFDMSGSMGEKCSGKRKIDGAKEAVTRFMKNVPDDVNIGLMLLGTRSGVDYAEALPIASGNKEEFLRIINSLHPSGGTPLGEALSASVDKIVEQYKKQLGYGTYRIIIITDGEQTGIDLKQPCSYLAQHGFIGLYSIGLCMNKSHTLKKYSLSYRDANNYEELEEALVEATAESDVFDANLFDENLYKADSTNR
ncbi:MAG: vWA domain-containing protein [Bacteroidales bacterium]